MSGPLRISIDGPAAAGKTTLGRDLAATYGGVFIDTGLTFRAVALAVYRLGHRPSIIDVVDILRKLEHTPHHPDAAEEVTINGDAVTNLIWSEDCNGVLPWVTEDAEIRTLIHTYHALLISAYARVVVAGRDVATTVLWNSDAYVYLDAAFAVRRDRRRHQLRSGERGTPVLGPKGKRDIRTREFVEHSPRGIVLDTTDHTPASVLERVIAHIAGGGDV